MRVWIFVLLLGWPCWGPAIAQQDKKTDDDKPADPDTGESTIQEKTLGLLPIRFKTRHQVRCDGLIGSAVWRTAYSGKTSPEPPNSFGKPFSFGTPSRLGKTVSA
jgi:hypothetical protein